MAGGATMSDETAKRSLADCPDKRFFKIGEAADIVDVAPHVLRYWEREFSVIKPYKSASKHRRYRRKDVELFLIIRRLLHEEKFTIAGARKYIKDNVIARDGNGEGHQVVRTRAEALLEAKRLTLEILELVEDE